MDQRASDGGKQVNGVVTMEKDGPGAMGLLVASLHKVKYSYNG